MINVHTALYCASNLHLLMIHAVVLKERKKLVGFLVIHFTLAALAGKV